MQQLLDEAKEGKFATKGEAVQRRDQLLGEAAVQAVPAQGSAPTDPAAPAEESSPADPAASAEESSPADSEREGGQGPEDSQYV